LWRFLLIEERLDGMGVKGKSRPLDYQTEGVKGVVAGIGYEGEWTRDGAEGIPSIRS
jgi:hypothetical protein